MKYSKSSSSSLLLGLVFLIITIVGFTPLLQVATGYLIIGTLSIVMMIVNLGSYDYKKNGFLVLSVVCYILICISYKFLGVSDAGYGVLIMHLVFFISTLLMLVIPKRLNKVWKWIVIIILGIIVFNILDNIRLCYMYPGIASIVNRDHVDEATSGMRLNFGGSQWYNGVFFFFIVCYFAFLNVQKGKIKNVMLVCSMISVLFIFGFCLKASVIIYTILAIVLLYYAKNAKYSSAFIARVAFVVIFVFLLVKLFAGEIVTLFANELSSERLVSRLIMIVDADNEAASTGVRTVNGRMSLWMMSIDTWLDNPINFLLGIGDHRANYSQGLGAAATGISQHSDFFDTLAKYGIVGALLVFNILRLSFKRILSLYESKYHLQLYVIFALFVVFGFTKGVFRPAVGCVMFFMLPVFSQYLKKSKLNQKIKLR